MLDKAKHKALLSDEILKKYVGFKEMKVVNSLKSLKKRDRNNRVIRRKGRVYVINKRNPRMKARQG